MIIRQTSSTDYEIIVELSDNAYDYSINYSASFYYTVDRVAIINISESNNIVVNNTILMPGKMTEIIGNRPVTFSLKIEEDKNEHCL